VPSSSQAGSPRRNSTHLPDNKAYHPA